MRFLVTRPSEDAAETARLLEARGIEPLVEPLLAIRPLPDAALPLDGAQALLLTSANGVRALAGATDRRDLRMFAVGDQTAAAARGAGFQTVESAGGDVTDLARLIGERLDPKAGALVHVAGSAQAGDLAGALQPQGFEVRRAVLYEARPVEALGPKTRGGLELGVIDGVLFFSPRTAKAFATLVEAAGLGPRCRRVTAFCLSPAVAEAAGALSWRSVVTAQTPTQPALFDALDDWRARPPEPEPALQSATPPSTGTPMSATPSDMEMSEPSPGPATPSRQRHDGASLAASPQRGLLLLTGALGIGGLAAGLVALVISLTTATQTPPAVGGPAAAAVRVGTDVIERRLDALAISIARIEQRAQAAEDGQRRQTTEIQRLAAQATAQSSAGNADTSRIAADLKGLGDRLNALQAEARQLAADLKAGTDQGLAGQRQLQQRLAQLDAMVAALPRIEPAEIDRLAARIDLLAGLEARIGKIEQRIGPEGGPVRPGEVIALAIVNAAPALAAAGPFDQALATLIALAGSDSRVQQAVAPIAPRAAKGVPTRDRLAQRLPGVVAEIVQANTRTLAPGLFGDALARMSRVVTVRRTDDVPGAGDRAAAEGHVDTLVNRAETLIADGDLAGAAAALRALPEHARAPAAGWLADADGRLAVERALTELHQIALAQLGARAAAK
jgi:uroporphyrinogen-III synthase